MTEGNLGPEVDVDLSRRGMLTAAAALVPVAVMAGASVATAQTSARAAPNGRAALVTGSSRGIGAATARRLARDGYAVTVNYRINRDLAAAVVREIETAGGRAISVQADVRDPRAVGRLFEANQRAFGGVDVVVNNAGVAPTTPFAEMTDAEFDLVTDTNIKGGFNVLREASRRVRDGGRIISLSSSVTEFAGPGYGPYAATKAALAVYSSVLAKELGGRRISVNAVAPGTVNTTLFTDGKTPQEIAGYVGRTPLGRLGEPDDIAKVISLLVSPDAFWASGDTVFVNGGLT